MKKLTKKAAKVVKGGLTAGPGWTATKGGTQTK